MVLRLPLDLLFHPVDSFQLNNSGEVTHANSLKTSTLPKLGQIIQEATLIISLVKFIRMNLQFGTPLIFRKTQQERTSK